MTTWTRKVTPPLVDSTGGLSHPDEGSDFGVLFLFDLTREKGKGERQKSKESDKGVDLRLFSINVVRVVKVLTVL